MSMEDYNFAKAREAWATPVKIVQYNCTCGRTMKFESEHGVIAPQHTWVGLDHHDKKKFSSWLDHKTDDEVFTAIEVKLKELNDHSI
jgi:hypothetical protein